MRALALLALGLSLPVLAAPAFDEVRRNFRGSEAVLLDREGVPLHVLRLDPTIRRLDWVPLAQVSPALREAVLVSEDKQFYAHGGVDWQALGAAALRNIAATRPRGASTLTMQVAALLEPERLGLGGKRGLRQKWEQVLAARELDAAWSKDQIFEAYLNLSTFRGELQGVEAAAQGLFRKSAIALDRGEAMLLAVLLRGPNATPVKLARRACALRAALSAATGTVPACADLQRQSRALPAARSLLTIGPQEAPHLAGHWLKEPGTRVLTSVRAELQRFARAALARRLRELEGRGIADGAVLVLDNASGEVLAYVGSSSARSVSPEVDGVLALRQGGAMLQPFLYGDAFERSWRNAASLIDDALALGDAGVSLLTLSNAYRTLANEGRASAPRFVPASTSTIRLRSAAVSVLVRDTWAENAARAGAFDLANSLVTPQWTAVKTSRSKDQRDHWCVGFSARYTVGVWMGSFSGDPMLEVSGDSGAAPLWRDLIDFLHRQEPKFQPRPAEGLAKAKLRLANEFEAEREEWFLHGSDLTFSVPTETPSTQPRILFPAPGMVLATDPSVPTERLRVVLLARPSRPDLRWRLDGQLMGAGPRVPWEPLLGAHRLRLEWGEAEGQELEFVVAGGAAERSR